jgi:uncharacterized protein YndB with AHSA1/START domain
MATTAASQRRLLRPGAPGSAEGGSTMERGLVARASISVHARPEAVWRALVDPAAIQEYFFGTTVVTGWQAGEPIVWRGVWQGREYEDKGTVLAVEPGRRLQFTHFSPLSGAADAPENYHTVEILLSRDGDQTQVTLSQDNNATEDERAHSAQNWETVLAGLKRFVES